MGVALLPDWLIDEDVDQGRLSVLFSDHQSTATDFDTSAWGLYPSRAYLPRKVKVMLEFLRASLKAR
jgi:DNA-binding transcriptional LysR family regulator